MILFRVDLNVSSRLIEWFGVLKASSHVLSVEGVRLKTALQSLMYQKSLRLSGSGQQLQPGDAGGDVNDDDDIHLDAGSFSQLLTEDCGNVMVSQFYIESSSFLFFRK